MRFLISALTSCFIIATASAAGVSVATFEIDVTPPIGAPLCGGGVRPAMEIDDPLSARGLAIMAEGQDPIVMCAVDWVGISNGGHDAWIEALAEAAGTTVDRVTVHTLHQHDAPFCDFTVEELMVEQGLGGQMFDVAFARDCIVRAGDALKKAMGDATPVTHIGIGKAKVDRFASNRRIIGEDGKVAHIRWTATADPKVRAYGVGTIDPYVRCISLWNGDEPVSVLTYYATHPQSHYGKGHVNADTVGMARGFFEEDLPGAAVIHFNGAGGNIGAGKYNNGAPENRPILAKRLYNGMALALDFTEKEPVAAADVKWFTNPTALPLREEVTLEGERQRLADTELKDGVRGRAAREIAYMARHQDGHKINLSLLQLGSASIMHMPGELCIEYQLAAQDMAPDRFIAMAAYGDYAPGYICPAIAYDQGGYEPQVYTSRTAPAVEGVLNEAMKALIEMSN